MNNFLVCSPLHILITSSLLNKKSIHFTEVAAIASYMYSIQKETIYE
jgi:hypothetical protein